MNRLELWRKEESIGNVRPRNAILSVARGTGLLTCGGRVSRGLPAHQGQWHAAPYFLPLTVAGQWRIFTAFPFIPRVTTAIETMISQLP